MPGRSGSKGRGGARRRAGHANPLVAPVLAGDPVERVVAVGRVIGINPVLAFRPVTAPAILINRDVATRDYVPPPAQDRTAHRFGGARHPGVGVIEFAPSIRRRDPIGRPVQDHREARAAIFRQKHKRVEPSAIAHRHHGLK